VQALSHESPARTQKIWAEQCCKQDAEAAFSEPTGIEEDGQQGVRFTVVQAGGGSSVRRYECGTSAGVMPYVQHRGGVCTRNATRRPTRHVR